MSAEREYPPLKEGFLHKLGDKGVVKLWKRRWFSLRGNRIYYCDEKDVAHAKFVGNIPLTKDTYVAFTVLAGSINPPKKNCTFQIQCHSNPRAWILCADTPQAKDEWIKAINAVVDSDQALPVATDGASDSDSSFIGRSSLVRNRSKKDNLSEPKDFRHRAHVDFQFNWSGQRGEDIFELQEKLGQGAYGSVYAAKHRETGFELAIKIVPIRLECMASLAKEVDVLKKCKNNNLLSYYGTVQRESEVWILMDVCQVGSIKEVMQLTLEPLTQDQMAQVACETLKGLVYLHQQDIIHLDVKAANIMITAEGNVKIGDFGVSETLRENVSIEATDFVGSPLYMAPEVIKKERYGKNADIWSLGITMIEMADTRPPNTDITSMSALSLLLKRAPPTVRRPKDFSTQFNEFIAQCLTADPEKRPTAIDMLMHPFARAAKGPQVFQAVIRSIMLIRAEMKERQMEEKRLRELEEQQRLVLQHQDKTKAWKILGPEGLQLPPGFRPMEARAPLSRIGSQQGQQPGGGGYNSDSSVGSGPMSPAAIAARRNRSNSDQAFIIAGTSVPTPPPAKPVPDPRKTSSAPPNLEPNYPLPGPSESGEAEPTPTPSSPAVVSEAALRAMTRSSSNSSSWRNSNSQLLAGGTGSSPLGSPNLSLTPKGGRAPRLGAARLSLTQSEIKALETAAAASTDEASGAVLPPSSSRSDPDVADGGANASAPGSTSSPPKARAVSMGAALSTKPASPPGNGQRPPSVSPPSSAASTSASAAASASASASASTGPSSAASVAVRGQRALTATSASTPPAAAPTGLASPASLSVRGQRAATARMPNFDEVKGSLAEVESKIDRVHKERDAARQRGETLIATQLTSMLETLGKQRDVLEKTVALLPKPPVTPASRPLSPPSSSSSTPPAAAVATGNGAAPVSAASGERPLSQRPPSAGSPTGSGAERRTRSAGLVSGFGSMHGIAIGPSAAAAMGPLGPRRVLGSPGGAAASLAPRSPQLAASPSEPSVATQQQEPVVKRSPSAPSVKPT